MNITQETLKALLVFLSQDKGAVAGLLLGQDVANSQKTENNAETVDDGRTD